MTIVSEFGQFLPPPLRDLTWRAHPLDGKLLLFERNSGLNVLLDGDETRQLRRVAPRSLLIAITNACNLTCSFCYRDLTSPSRWRYDTLLQFCQDADAWGVLEVAFGGGEPMLFPRWPDFINQLYATTTLRINFTTNGTLLTEDFLCAISGKYGQIRVSLYEDNHWPETLTLLSRCQARFGVNWLITPAELDGLESSFTRLLTLGVRDFLLLSYKGDDSSLHLASAGPQQLAAFVNKVYQQLGSVVQIKLDSCWGDSLPEVPRLFDEPDCGAGDDFLSITSDKHVKVCSFQRTNTGIPFGSVADLRRIWESRRSMRHPALIAGCARLPNRGLSENGVNRAYLDLAPIQ